MRTQFWILAGALLVTSAVATYVRLTSLPRQFEQRRGEMLAKGDSLGAILTEADIAPLPDPVRRYVERSGSLGKPRTLAIELEFDADMFDAPGAQPMSGRVLQYERFDVPRRLFVMSSRMKGMPVAVLHVFNGDQATMQVRLAGLFNVVDLKGPDLTRTETVTILNDLCFFAPSLLSDPRLAWTAIDATHASVAFTLGANTVSALLTFDSQGDLVDFRSEDRGALQKDGSLKILPWTTPMRAYQEFDGRRVASEGEAIWHYPEAPFTYGQMRLVAYRTP